MTNMALRWALRMCRLVTVVILLAVASYAQDPCANNEHRALILSGGGVKGAFEAGAIYHLVLLRGCDFQDFAGVSVGALNAAVLAQAAPLADSSESLAQLKLHTEAMVELWESFQGSQDIMRHRFLAGLRFALFGAEQMNDFVPLRRTLKANVSPEKVATGRLLRIGVTSFWDGDYREIAVGGKRGTMPPGRFMDYLYASSIMPVIGRMPRIADDNEEPNSRHASQFGDGSLRHVTPVSSYFVQCALSVPECRDDAAATPAHESLQQLFVIVTSPYTRGAGFVPVADSNCCRPGTTLITKGPKVMRRTIALMVDTPYRSDLDSMWIANDILQWRLELYRNMESGKDSDSRRQLDLSPPSTFPVESYNHDLGQDYMASRPYMIALIKPEKETADIGNLLSLSPQTIRDQLLSGCLAADQVMASQFGLPPMDEACRARFAYGAKHLE